MDISTIDLNLLVAFELLMQERSVTAAARRAHVSPSAMSHMLRRLRTLLSNEVLVRQGQQMVPTPQAEALAVPIRELLSQARSVFANSSALDPGNLRRIFRLACTDAASTVLTAEIRAILGREAPGVDLCIHPMTADVAQELRDGAVDAAIGLFHLAPPEMVSRRIYTDRLVTVARLDHPRRGAGALSLDDFVAEAHIEVTAPGEPRGAVDRLLAEDGLSRRIALRVPDSLAALWYVLETDYLFTTSQRLVEATQHVLPVRMLAVPLPLAEHPVGLMWHPRTHRAPADVWFRDLLIRAAGDISE